MAKAAFVEVLTWGIRECYPVLPSGQNKSGAAINADAGFALVEA
jgi:hypothetical protein